MKTLLLIEDNLDIRENITEMLELEGYSVIVAVDGGMGYQLAVEEIPDIILCDIMMPVMNGYEVLKHMKNNSSTAHIPFIFISASTEKKDIQIGIDMGASAYIRKPFEMEELFDVVAKFCPKDYLQ
jgi:CheY-like chemotaxis protein